ncbi:MAG TPA: uracil-DNA glycosylase [Candidatus Nanoarchaeia archaeon]|nr:uracil-DNA glycosylase [Candidatus Nanoarchaeia archaeon]
MPTLFSLAEEIRKCTACPLWKGTTLAVPGEGAKDAKIMVVGEAPGAEEDRQGIPFVGRSGKFLDKMLELGGLDRKTVFITNTVKHRPPLNRAPKASEIKVCKELWLDEQIKILKPKLIIVLGGVALKTLVGKGTVEKLHGKIIKKNGQQYFVTYHPAALRYPENRQKMEDDFRKLKKILSKI